MFKIPALVLLLSSSPTRADQQTINAGTSEPEAEGANQAEGDCQATCKEEAERVNPVEPDSYYTKCVDAQCRKKVEKPPAEYEFDPSCQKPYAFDCTNLTYDENDKCYSVCQEPPEEAKKICESYCRGETNKQALETEQEKQEYNYQCQRDSCGGLKYKVMGLRDRCIAECESIVEAEAIASPADAMLFHNFCYKNNCAKYGENPDIPEVEVDQACWAKCEDFASRNTRRTETEYKDYMASCYKYNCVKEYQCADAGFVDCSQYGGYDTRDRCKQTCISKTPITTKKSSEQSCKEEMDSMRKYDQEEQEYVGYSTQEKIYYFDFCISDYAYFNVMNPEYMGCFMDTRQRDLQTLIGQDLTVRDCFNKAKEREFSFVAFQNGNECWADTSVGKYPRVSELECRVACDEEPGRRCGGTMRNAIWDIREYQSNASTCVSKRPVNCAQWDGYDLEKDECKGTCHKRNVQEECYDSCGESAARFKGATEYFKELTGCYDGCNGKGAQCPYTFVDCSQLGGYDPQDACRQTCLLEEKAKDPASCEQTCSGVIVSMKFSSDSAKTSFFEMCNRQCTELTNPNPCTEKFVDCSKYGGYDPKDKCKQTCQKKEDQSEYLSCQNQCRMKLSGTELSSPETFYQSYQSCQDSCNALTISCNNKCKALMSKMRFISTDAETQYQQSCRIKCKLQSSTKAKDETPCSGKFVDCSRNGGYDPIDPCRQTCVQPFGEQLKKTQRDTTRDELTLRTTSIIKYGQQVAVKCFSTNGQIECFDEKQPDMKIQFDETAPVGFNPVKAPGGREWRYNCNLWEYFFSYDNCWNGGVQKAQCSLVAIVVSFGVLSISGW